MSCFAFLYIKINKGKTDNFIQFIQKVDQNECWLLAYEVSRIEGIGLKDIEMEKMRRTNVSFLDQEIERKLK